MEKTIENPRDLLDDQNLLATFEVNVVRLVFFRPEISALMGGGSLGAVSGSWSITKDSSCSHLVESGSRAYDSVACKILALA